VTVNLLGGLGNQLFCYSFGRYLAKFLGIEVTFEAQPLFRPSNHGVSLVGRNLRGSFVMRGGTVPSRFIAVASLELQERYPYLQRWLPTLTGAQYCPEPGIPDLKVRTGGILHGYFQITRFATKLIGSELTWDSLLPDTGPSQWLSREIEEAQSNEIVALHFRRKDYTAHPAWGLLDRKYYDAALDQLPSRLSSAPIWVFSDDPDRAEHELSSIRGNVRFIRSPGDVDVAESLILMSRASAVVTANSTFSWWAGALSDFGTTVVAPSPWFPSHYRDEFYLPEWIQLDSVFQ